MSFHRKRTEKDDKSCFNGALNTSEKIIFCYPRQKEAVVFRFLALWVPFEKLNENQ